MPFKIIVEEEILDEIQQVITWYNEQKPKLGRKFYTELKTCFETLKINPFSQIRYEQVRCIPLNKFPYLIHFTVDEEGEKVIIRAIFHTSRNPKF